MTEFDVGTTEVIVTYEKGGLVSVGGVLTFQAQALLAVARHGRSLHVVVAGTTFIFVFKYNTTCERTYTQFKNVLLRAVDVATRDTNSIARSLQSLATRHGTRSYGDHGDDA